MSALDNIVIPAAISFGSTTVRGFRIRNTSSAKGGNQYDGKIDQTDNSDKELYRSLLNTPVLSNITFLAGKYTDNSGVEKVFEQLVYEAVLLNVSQAKKIIRTEIQGRDGTVKEYIGMDDYQVIINGIITGPNGRYPLEEVRSLKDMLDAPIPIEVACTFLQNLDVDTIVISNYEFPQQEGGYSYQQFSITAMSDIPQELRIKNNA
jgi:hypothetical protein